MKYVKYTQYFHDKKKLLHKLLITNNQGSELYAFKKYRNTHVHMHSKIVKYALSAKNIHLKFLAFNHKK